MSEPTIDYQQAWRASLVTIKEQDRLITWLRRRIQALERAMRPSLATTSMDGSLGAAEGQLVLEEVMQQALEAEALRQLLEREKNQDDKKPDRRSSSGHSRGGTCKALDDGSLQVVQVHNELPEDQRLGPDGKPLPVIDESRQRVLAYSRAFFYIKEIVTPIYGQPDEPLLPVVAAPPPPRVIPGGQVDDSVLAALFVSVFADHLPAYRLEEQARRTGVELTRGTICRWIIRLAMFLMPIYDQILLSLTGRNRLHIDDTTFRLINPVDSSRKKEGASHLGRIWGLAVEQEAWYTYTDTREGHWLHTLLNDFEGVIVGDDYRGHTKLLAMETILAAYCWAHVLRKFRECADAVDAPVVVADIRRLYAIEDEIRHLPAPERLAERQERSRPIVTLIETQVDDLVLRTAPKQDLGLAARYAQRLRPGLRRFLDHPDVPLDNNTCERALRRVAISRKNRLFAIGESGAEANAIGFTLIECCKRAQVDPQAWLTAAIASLHGGEDDPDRLRPIRWAAERATMERASAGSLGEDTVVAVPDGAVLEGAVPVGGDRDDAGGSCGNRSRPADSATGPPPSG